MPVLLMIVAVAVTILAIVLWRKIKHHKQVNQEYTAYIISADCSVFDH